jgi:hypothetical protein
MHTIDVFNVALEYAVWLLPVGFVLMGIYKIIQKSGEAEGLFLALHALVITTVSITIKEFLLLHEGVLGFSRPSLIGNALILIGYIFLLLSARKLIKKVYKFYTFETSNSILS